MSYKKAEEVFTQLKDFLKRKLSIATNVKDVHDKSTKDMFAQLSPRDQLELIKPQIDFFTSAVSRKTEILPTLATLASALVVVATLNPDLVPLNPNDSKWILSIFLALIPITLHYYIKLMERTAIEATNIIRSYNGEDPFRNIKISFLVQLGSDLPILVVYLFYAVIFVIMFRMWHP